MFVCTCMLVCIFIVYGACMLVGLSVHLCPRTYVVGVVCMYVHAYVHLCVVHVYYMYV